MNEDSTQPIGEAQPIEVGQGGKILRRVGAILGVTLGGLAFASLLVPTRLAGASRSARLLWQDRQAEIHGAIRNQEAAEVNTPESVSLEPKASSRR